MTQSPTAPPPPPQLWYYIINHLRDDKLEPKDHATYLVTHIENELPNLRKTHPNDKFQVAKKNWVNQDHVKLHTGKWIKTILFELNKNLT